MITKSNSPSSSFITRPIFVAVLIATIIGCIWFAITQSGLLVVLSSEDKAELVADYKMPSRASLQRPQPAHKIKIDTGFQRIIKQQPKMQTARD